MTLTRLSMALLFCIGSFGHSDVFGIEAIVSFPTEGCHAITKDANIYLQAPKSPYLKWDAIQSRADVVCVGRDIVVDKQLRSNGGDVFIYADSITLKARIDTRPFINTLAYMHIPAVTSGAGQALHSPKARPMFDDYYQRSPQAVRIGAKLYVPEGVSGTTPRWMPACEARYTPGESPPDHEVNFDALRSGSIYLYANKLVFDANDAEVEIDDSDPLDCKGGRTVRQDVYLLADGVRGGRGGAAALTAPFGGDLRYGCMAESYRRAGALNAPGGRGADAGSVHVTIVARSLGQEERERIVKHSSASPGPPGSTRKLRTPAFLGPSGAKSADACAFLDEGEWPSASEGAEGAGIALENAAATDALLSFMKLIGLKDSAFDYNLIELSERAYVDHRITSADFTTFVESALYRQLRDVERTFLQGLNARILRKAPSIEKPLPSNFEGLDLGKLDARLFRERVAQIVAELARFESVSPEEALDAYFLRSGGALNLRDAQVQETWGSLLARAEVARTVPMLVQVRASLHDSNLLLNSINQVLWTAEYKSELSRLNARLQEVERQLKSIAPGLSQLQAVSGAVSGIADGVAKIYAGYQSGNVALAMSGSGRLAQASQGLLNAVASAREFVNQRAELRQQIDDLEAALVEFLRASSVAKERFTNLYAKALLDFIQAQARLETMFDVRGHLFGDLLSASLLTYFSDPSRDINSLTFNLRSLYAALSGNREATFRFRTPLRTSCTPNDGEKACKVVGAGPVRVVRIQSGQWYGGIPIQVLAATLNGFYVPTMGEELEVTPAPQ